MALKREFLKGLNLTDDQIVAIIEAHTDTVDAIKKERDRYKAEAEKLPDIQKELDDLKAADWKSKYEKEHTSFDDSKKDISTKEIPKYFDKYISLVLIIDNIKEVTTKKNDVMAFITASDEFGKTSLTLFPNTYKQYNNIKKKDIIRVKGRVEKRFDQYQILINNLEIIN